MKRALIVALVFLVGCPSDDDASGNNANNANNSNNSNNQNNSNNSNNVNNANNVNNSNNVNNVNNVNNAMDMGAADTGGDAAGDTAPDVPRSNLSFFVTSVGTGAAGGDLGGLDGADGICARLATAVNAGDRDWKAYLSTSDGTNARDRIGTGPWFNSAQTMVAADVASLHDDGIPEADIIDENGVAPPREEHDIMTGSDEDGMAMRQNCDNWTSNDGGTRVRVGHSDYETTRGAWNSVHQSDCDEDGLAATLSSGRIYCFAAD